MTVIFRDNLGGVAVELDERKQSILFCDGYAIFDSDDKEYCVPINMIVQICE